MSAANALMMPLEGFENFGTEKLARLTGAPLRTVRRWIQHGRAPRHVVVWLQVVFRGVLGLIAPEFEGWHLRRGALESPEGYRFSADEITAIMLRRQQISALECEIRQLTAQLRERDEREAQQRAEQEATAQRIVVVIETTRRDVDCFQIVHASATLEAPAPIARRQALTAATHQ